MRVVYFLILVLLVAAVGLFAWQNTEEVTLRYLDRSVTQPLSLLIAVVYFLGMLSGWTVVGFLKRSLQRVTDRRAK
jgi:lipopolysaccharide assembly protein A